MFDLHRFARTLLPALGLLCVAACSDGEVASEDDASADLGADIVDDANDEDAETAGDAGVSADSEEDAVTRSTLACEGGPAVASIPGPGDSILRLAFEPSDLELAVAFSVTDAAEITLACVDGDITPAGVVPLTPAFSLTADVASPFERRAFFSMPFANADLPAGALPSDVRVYHVGPSGEVRTPVVMNLQENLFRGTVRFDSELTGVFQLGVLADAGPRDREWTFRAVTGVSMGAMGASMLATRNPEAFDIVGSLGGPVEWQYLVHYIRDGAMGGFGPAPDFGLTPPYAVTEEFEHPMTYNDWYFPTGEGTGGTFARGDYHEIFHDLSLTVGNFVSYNPESPYRAVGMPIEVLQQPAAARCYSGRTCPPEDAAETFTIATGFYDDEYNPDGTLPVIAFCDGRGSADPDIPFDRACDVDFDGRPDETNRGLLDDACAQPRPVDITYAVDLNGNGIRDPEEPVIRNFWEPYEDLGTDGLSSNEEEGYDARTNPDPAGDDYDYVRNPLGTEGNWVYDEGEPYLDLGLDGVAGTLDVSEGGYDWGEANGRFDYNPNVANALQNYSPRANLSAMNDAARADLTWFMDAGIRDLFNFGVGANQLLGTMHALGMNVRVYEQFFRAADLDPLDARDFDFTALDYDLLGDHVYIRYGDVDASEEDICFGDGKHLGTVQQAANRLLTMLGFVTNRFPDGDRTTIEAPFPLPNGTFFAPTDTTGGVMKYSIAFPPGYERTACVDGIDNDGDGRIDGDDESCESAADLSESGESVDYCTDGIDNDVDGLADGEDPDCVDGDGTSEWPEGSPFRDTRFPVVYLLHGYGQSPEDLQVTALPFSGFMAQGIWPKIILVFPDGYCGSDIERTACNDGIDNDGDELIDADDEGCAESGGRSETGEATPYCSDGVDNDRDGLADLDDPGCRTPEWESEANCVQGNFYVDHQAWGDGTPNGPAYEELFFDLVDYVDATYRTRSPESFPE